MRAANVLELVRMWVMRYLNWPLRIVLFMLLLGFAVKNDQAVTLHYFFGYEWHSSVMVVSLIFFASGAAVGTLAMLPRVLRQRREMLRLRRLHTTSVQQ